MDTYSVTYTDGATYTVDTHYSAIHVHITLVTLHAPNVHYTHWAHTCTYMCPLSTYSACYVHFLYMYMDYTTICVQDKYIYIYNMCIQCLCVMHSTSID